MTYDYNCQGVILKTIGNVSSVHLSLLESFICCITVELDSTG